jgi:hypothetical protein
LSEFASIPDVIKNNLAERLPEKLMILLQEKTKKKLMKEKTVQQTPKHEPPFKNIPPPSVVKKDCLTINLTLHVIVGSLRSSIRMEFPSLCPFWSTLSNATPRCSISKASSGSQDRLRRKRKLSSSWASSTTLRSSKTSPNTVDLQLLES